MHKHNGTLSVPNNHHWVYILISARVCYLSYFHDFAMISILEDIITIAGRYRAPSGSCASVGIPSTRTPLSLPDPPSLLTPLLNLGATAQIAEGMNKMFQTRACELRERYHSAISKAQTELDKHDSPHSASTEKQLASALTQCYLKTLREWKEEAITMLQKKLSSLCQKPPAGYPPPKSTSFNHVRFITRRVNHNINGP